MKESETKVEKGGLKVCLEVISGHKWVLTYALKIKTNILSIPEMILKDFF